MRMSGIVGGHYDKQTAPANIDNAVHFTKDSVSGVYGPSKRLEVKDGLAIFCAYSTELKSLSETMIAEPLTI